MMLVLPPRFAALRNAGLSEYVEKMFRLYSGSVTGAPVAALTLKGFGAKAPRPSSYAYSLLLLS